MADVELLPLPEGYDKYDPPLLYEGQMFHEGQMRAYARANVAHATAPLQAEIERLQAEVERSERYEEQSERERLRVEERAERLEKALRKVAQALEWFAHGRLRGFDDGPLLSTSEAVELAERTLAKVLGHDDAAIEQEAGRE